MTQVSGLKVLITGGSSGIGKATAKLFASKGAIVGITGRDKKKLEKVAQQIKAIPVDLDVTKYASIDAKILDAFHLMGGIDVLINNAGIGSFGDLSKVKISHFEQTFATNVFGLTLVTQEVVKFFKAQEKGTIINIGSTAASRGFAGGSVYSSSKFALRGLTQCWRNELRKHNIRVMLVNPSEVPTAFNAEDRVERKEVSNKLRSEDIAHAIQSVVTMDSRGFIPELEIWATNPF